MKKAIILGVSFVEAEGVSSHTVNFQIIENDSVIYKGDLSIDCVDLGSSKEEYEFSLKSKIKETCKQLGHLISPNNIIIL